MKGEIGGGEASKRGVAASAESRQAARRRKQAPAKRAQAVAGENWRKAESESSQLRQTKALAVWQ
jgi:hypothetical protein